MGPGGARRVVGCFFGFRQDRRNDTAGARQVVPSLDLVSTAEEGYVTEEEAKARKLTIRKLSGTDFRRRSLWIHGDG